MPQILLRDLAHARSGDKGANANIGIIAYTPAGYELLYGLLTPQRVQEFFISLHPQQVWRYELPKLLAFNFVLSGVLDGGGSRSLRVDAQGKTLGQALLYLPLEVPSEFSHG